MSKIFEKNQGPDIPINRNTFDLSFANHLSLKIGQLTPVFCKEVLPGDSFKIDSAFGLRFAPLAFPLQSKLHATLHYFYVRNRNLYDKWMDKIGGTDDSAVLPYRQISTSRAKSQIGTGSLGDYLGVPSTIAGEFANYSMLDLSNGESTIREASELGRSFRQDFVGTPIEKLNRTAPYWFSPYQFIAGFPFTSVFEQLVARGQSFRNSITKGKIPAIEDSNDVYWCIPCFQPLPHPFSSSADDYFSVINPSTSASDNDEVIIRVAVYRGPTSLNDALPVHFESLTFFYHAGSNSWRCPVADFASAFNDYLDFNLNNYLVFIFDNVNGSKAIQSTPNVLSTDEGYTSFGDSLMIPISDAQIRDATDADSVSFNPFVGPSPKIRLNALPFRAYESIYNAFYRNEVVDPFILDGKPCYNDYIRSHAGGADTLDYDLQYRNWEMDYFTSGQSSPQFGEAPLVGISGDGTFTFSDGTNTYQATATIGDDGETITGISTYDPNLPKSSLRRLVDTITNGISINDLRNVNSLQRWLENNIRKGLKYVDTIRAHFNVTPAYKACDMPEFIGGVHSVVDVNQVTNTNGDAVDGLGSYGGQASCLGGAQHSTTKYCDEHGFIIGILCVYPEPVYSQMLPKFFLKTQNQMQYYFPEFKNIGLQPITFEECVPIQVSADDYANNTDTIKDVFAYQRAWSDYIASNDELHGDMRTDLNDYTMNRVFRDKPQLGHNFVAISPDDVNNVFIDTKDDAKVFGQIRFNVSAKRPIPRFGIPSLE